MIGEGRGVVGIKGFSQQSANAVNIYTCQIIKHYEVNTTTSFTIAYQTRGSGNSAIGKFLFFLMHKDLMRS